jgi:hypothetical protein
MPNEIESGFRFFFRVEMRPRKKIFVIPASEFGPNSTFGSRELLKCRSAPLSTDDFAFWRGIEIIIFRSV